MRAIVLARGQGTRMRRADPSIPIAPDQAALADAGLKALIPFGRPFLDYVLSALADAGCVDVCLVVGPEQDAVRRYYTHVSPTRRVALSFAIQESARGTADALLAAEGFAGRDAFLVLNADNYYPTEVLHALAALDGPGLPAFDRRALVERGTIEPERIQSYALLQVDQHGFLEDIVEKPDAEAFRTAGREATVSMNCWRFDHGIFEACRRLTPSARGELELPEAVRLAIREMGARFRTIPVAAEVLDLSSRRDIPVVAERLKDVEARP
jgi:glucose-1-phosphate thymidylyltransferase